MFAFVDPFKRDDGPRANIITKTNGPTLSTIGGFPTHSSLPLRRSLVVRSLGGIFIRTRIDDFKSRTTVLERGLSKNKHFFSYIATNPSVGLPELSYTNYRILISSSMNRAIFVNSAFREESRVAVVIVIKLTVTLDIGEPFRDINF